MYGDGVRVIDGGEGLGLPFKAVKAHGVLGPFRGEGFKGDAALEARVCGEIYVSHTAAADLGFDSIWAERAPHKTEGRKRSIERFIRFDQSTKRFDNLGIIGELAWSELSVVNLPLFYPLGEQGARRAVLLHTKQRTQESIGFMSRTRDIRGDRIWNSTSLCFKDMAISSRGKAMIR